MPVAACEKFIKASCRLTRGADAFSAHCGAFQAVGEDARNLPARVQGPTQSRAIHATGTARSQPAPAAPASRPMRFSAFKQCAVDVSGANDGQAASAENRRFAATIKQRESAPA